MKVVLGQGFLYFCFFAFGAFASWVMTKWNATQEQIHKCENCEWFKGEIEGVSVEENTSCPELVEGSQEIKPWMARIPKEDMEILGNVADRYNLHGHSRYLLFAIYIVENGGPGREMGVLNEEAQRFKGDHKTSLRIQAEWAAGTIQRRYDGDLKRFARRWAPSGAENDPKGLNQYWLPNIKKIMAEMVG